MTALNLTAETPEEKKIKTYLQENASDVLAEKINNGIRIQKDGKVLISRKTLNAFMRYANEEARKAAAKGANCVCIDDPIVYGWAIHYFEEDSIEGKLYNEDGTEYAPPKPAKQPSTPSIPYTPPKPKPEPQLSMFDMLGEQKKEEPKPVAVQTALSDQANDHEPVDEADEEPGEEELAEAMEQTSSTPIPPIEKQPSALYQHYLNIQNKYSDAVVALRVGDFYEVFGENAVKIAKELDMTLTGRDCGLQERIPMIGFPFHAADSYIDKLIGRGYKVAIAEDIKTNDVTVKEPDLYVDEETGEVLPVEEMRRYDGDIEELKLPAQQAETPEDDDDDLPTFNTKAYDPEALAILDELFGNTIILR